MALFNAGDNEAKGIYFKRPVVLFIS